jgi:hypothetical protein
MRRLNVVIVTILVMVVVTGFPCYGYGDVIYGCYQKNSGQLRILTDDTECKPSEVRISWPGHSGPATIVVDCNKGETIANALQQLGSPITIQVKGTCTENVEIMRDDVTLKADPSAGTITGPDSTKPTIRVRAARTVIDGLLVTGGSSGVSNVGGDVTIQNCMVRNTGSSAILFFHGGRGTVDNCIVQDNARHGIYIEGASATVTNSTISSNTSTGIKVVSGAARIGINTLTQYAGNTISDNGAGGIQVVFGGSAFIGGNIISGNGTVPELGQFGIGVMFASADIVGYNSIIDNGGRGVFAVSSTVQIGDLAFPLPQTGTYANVITGNGPAISGSNGGIIGISGTSLTIRNATIDGNTGNGIMLDSRSIATIFGGTVNNNAGNGILLQFGGGLVLPNPAAEVFGNTLFGLQCFGTESSYGGNTSGIAGNASGEVSGNCTGF